MQASQYLTAHSLLPACRLDPKNKAQICRQGSKLLRLDGMTAFRQCHVYGESLWQNFALTLVALD